jgi:Tol biopolymer transport system component
MKLAVVVTAAALGIAFGATSSQASTSSPIVFAADRAPTVTGEIWRLDPNGHRVDLSKSPYQDVFPAVSWDGKHVAFLSDRAGTGTTALYELGIDGRGLRRLGLSLADPADAGCLPELGWAPDGTLAVMACRDLGASVWLVHPGQKPVKILTAKRGPQYGFSWSPQGLLAVQTGSSTSVYDTNGRLRARTQSGGDSRPVWSPTGNLLAFEAGNSTVVTASGSQVIRKNTSRGDVAWVDASHVAVGAYFGKCGCETKLLDVRTGTLTTAKAANWFSARSADGKLAVVVPGSKTGSFRVGVAPPAGGKVKIYGAVPGCWRDQQVEASPGSFQFAGSSIVYESWDLCDPPFANLYSVSPRGGGVERLTNVPAQETQPAVSPDGSEIAYVWASNNGMSCAGCTDGIRLASADGHAIRTLTNPQNCTFDDSPTWSPDGTTILYAETGCDSPDELFTVPARGGTPHDLHVAGSRPAWGPTRIAYEAKNGLMTAKPDGTDPQLVAKHGLIPAWSKGGDLAYLSGSYSARTLVVGSHSARLPFAQVIWLAWTPDSKRLVVVAGKTRLGPFDLYTVKPDGTNPMRLTKNYGASGAHYTYSP